MLEWVLQKLRPRVPSQEGSKEMFFQSQAFHRIHDILDGFEDIFENCALARVHRDSRTLVTVPDIEETLPWAVMEFLEKHNIALPKEHQVTREKGEQDVGVDSQA